MVRAEGSIEAVTDKTGYTPVYLDQILCR